MEIKELTDGINKTIAERARQSRLERGIGLQELAVQLGITYQMLQKHERNQSPLTAARLALIAKITSKPISFFFDKDMIKPFHTYGNNKLSLAVFRAWNNINICQQEKLLDLIKAMGKPTVNQSTNQ